MSTEAMENSRSISLVDNTAPSEQPPSGESSRRPSKHTHRLSKHISRTSVSDQLAKRKYAKWQPDKLGLSTDTDTSPSRESSQVRGSVSAESSAGPTNGANPEGQSDHATEITRVDTVDFAPSQTQSIQSSGAGQPSDSDTTAKPVTELDILYENQRGWFFFGVPRYSHNSLLNLDPSAWMTQDKRPSPVNITNAQVPDPSWEWAWRTWYVDMSGDVDEQGWQYSFSFGSSQWHGTHPWFHSFARRRRWIRLRQKVPERRYRGRSEFEKAHMLTEDYFTIHSSKVRSREQSAVGLSRIESGYLSRAATGLEEEPPIEEIGDIPSLMYALKLASIDRERIDVLKKFVEQGGEELYYLNDKIPEIMPTFLFQASRWQFVTYLVSIINQLSTPGDDQQEDSNKIKRKKDNLIRVVESAKQHVTGPDVFTGTGGSASELLDLTPISRHDTLLSKRAQATDEPLHVMKQKEITGIPKAAEIGHEGHIY
ncbi:peroxin Pex23-like-Penicillium chrysogenum [Penicillium odoratum]|uniref:peroxin Pex23-like-Penicillium chrysogenum n=1 Tax=Penicillium odoratum TaxID=1167516 RepID=UPI002546BD29|nr:peroxin Pex23-like-Penicillium chrysogenum [Penicillium odoratum]KAJ5760821.1 peroxin Pex23-like-Penicillium chrysogenum [Penicillium odoratum]